MFLDWLCVWMIVLPMSVAWQSPLLLLSASPLMSVNICFPCLVAPTLAVGRVNVYTSYILLSYPVGLTLLASWRVLLWLLLPPQPLFQRCLFCLMLSIASPAFLFPFSIYMKGHLFPTPVPSVLACLWIWGDPCRHLADVRVPGVVFFRKSVWHCCFCFSCEYNFS